MNFQKQNCLHIEGSLEPEMMFELAQRNQIETPYASVDQIRGLSVS